MADRHINYPELAFFNATVLYKEMHPGALVDPTLEAAATVETPDGTLQCTVWRNVRKGMPVWERELKLNGGTAPAPTEEERPAGVALGSVAQWAEERLVISPHDRALALWPLLSSLYEDFTAWARQSSVIDVPTQKAFAQRMRMIEGLAFQRGTLGMHVKHAALVGEDGAVDDVEADLTEKAEAKAIREAGYAETNRRTKEMHERIARERIEDHERHERYKDWKVGDPHPK